MARLSRSRALRAAPFALTGAHVGQSGLTDPGERNANKSRVSPVRCASPVARYLSRHRDVMTCLALSFADDHLENGRGLFAGAADVDHVDLCACTYRPYNRKRRLSFTFLPSPASRRHLKPCKRAATADMSFPALELPRPGTTARRISPVSRGFPIAAQCKQATLIFGERNPHETILVRTGWMFLCPR